LGSVLTGVLITSLNGGKNAMDALKDAAEAMDKVITISSQGWQLFLINMLRLPALMPKWLRYA
jgi:phage protein U